MRESRWRVLVVSADIAVMREIAAIPGGTVSVMLEWVSGAAEAIDLLARHTHEFVLAIADKTLADGTAFDVFRYVRRDPACPYPGMALALAGEVLTEADIRRSALLGCLHFLGRPFQPEAVNQGLAQWPIDRTDFILTGSYAGPDRRRALRRNMVERRTVAGPAEQTVASTSIGFEIRPSTTVFRFRRMATGESDSALALRNGLSRETLEAARGHIRLKKEQALAMLGHIRHRLDDAYDGLVEAPDREGLKRLNALAREAAALTETRGLLLVGAILRGLVGHSADDHPPGHGRLEVLRAHLDALRTALDGAVVDDGGIAGQQIRASLKATTETLLATGPGTAGGYGDSG